jgi:anti-anti-sigma factor
MATNPVVPTPDLELNPEHTPTETIFRCTGKITASTVEVFQDTVRHELMNNKCIVLDLSNVSYMDSSGLGVLVGLWVSAKRKGCYLRLISLSARVKELLRLTNMDKLFAASRFPDTPSF